MTALSISIPFGEGDLRGHGNLAFAPVNRHNSTSKVARFSVDFDALRKELLLYLKNIKKNTSIGNTILSKFTLCQKKLNNKFLDST